MHAPPAASLFSRQGASRREAKVSKVTAHLPAGASSAAASNSHRPVMASSSDPERSRKQKFRQDQIVLMTIQKVSKLEPNAHLEAASGLELEVLLDHLHAAKQGKCATFKQLCHL